MTYREHLTIETEAEMLHYAMDECHVGLKSRRQIADEIKRLFGVYPSTADRMVDVAQYAMKLASGEKSPRTK